MLSFNERVDIFEQLVACFVSYPIHSLSDLSDGQLFHHILWELGNEQQIPCLSQAATFAKINNALKLHFMRENLVEIKALQDGNLEEVAKMLALCLYLSTCVFKNEQVQDKIQKGLGDNRIASSCIKTMLEAIQENHSCLTRFVLCEIVLGQAVIPSGSTSPMVYGYSPHPSPARSFGGAARSPITPKLTSMQAALKTKTQENRELNRQLTTEQNEKFALTEAAKCSQRRIQELEKVVLNLRKEIQDLNTQVNASPSPRHGIGQGNWEAKKLQKDLAELEKAQIELQGLKSDNEALRQAKENMETKLHVVERQLRQASENNYTLELQCSTLETELQTSKQSAEELEELHNEKLNTILGLQERVRECEDNHLSFVLSPRQPEDSVGFQLLSEQFEELKKEMSEKTQNWESQVASLQGVLLEKEHAIKLATEEKGQLTSEFNSQIVTLTENAELKLSQLKETLDSQASQFQAQVVQFHTEKTRLEEALSNKEIRENQLNDIIKDLESNYVQLEQTSTANLASKGQELQEKAEKLTEYQQKSSMWHQELEKLQSTYEATELERENVQTQLESLLVVKQTLSYEKKQLLDAEEELKNALHLASENLQSLTANNVALVGIKGDLETQVANLTQEAEQKLLQFKESQEIQASHFQAQIADLRNERTTLEERLHATEARELELNNGTKELERKYIQLEQTLTTNLATKERELQQQTELLMETEQTSSALRQELDNLKSTYETVQLQKLELDDQFESLLAEKQALSEDKQKLWASQERLVKELQVSQDTLQAAETQHAALITIQADLQSQISILSHDAEQLKVSQDSQAAQFQEQILQFNEEKATLQDALSVKETREIQLNVAMKELEGKYAQLEQTLSVSLASKEGDLQEKAEQLMEYQQKSSALRQELDNLKSTYETVQLQKLEVHDQFESLLAEKQALSEDKQKLWASQERLIMELQVSQDTLQAAETQHAALITIQADLQSQISILSHDAEQLKVSQDSQAAQFQEQMLQFNEEKATLQDTLSVKETREIQLNVAMKELEGKYAQLEQTLSASLASKEGELQEKTEQLVKYQQNSSALRQELENLQSMYKTTESQKNTLQSQFESLSIEKQALSDDKMQLSETWEELKKELQVTQETVEALKIHKTDLLKTQTDLESQISNLTHDAEQKITQLKLSQDTQASLFQAKLIEFNEEKANLEKALHLKQTSEIKLNDYVKELEGKYVQLQQTLTSDITLKEQELQQQSQQLTYYQEKSTTLNHELEKLQSAYEMTESQKNNLLSQLDSLLLDKQTVSGEKQQLLEAEEKLKNGLRVARENLEKLQSVFETTESQKDNLKSQLDSLLVDKQTLSGEKQQLLEAEEKLKNELRVAHENFEALNSSHVALTNTRADLESQISELTQEAEQKLMQLKDSQESQASQIAHLSVERTKQEETLRLKEIREIELNEATKELERKYSQLEQTLSANLTTKDQELRQQAQVLTETEQRSSELREELEKLQSSFESTKLEKNNLESQLENLAAEQQTLLEEKEQLLASQNCLNEELQTSQEKLSVVQTVVAERILVLERNQSESQSQKTTVTQELEQAMVQLQEMQQCLASVRTQASDLQIQLSSKQQSAEDYRVQLEEATSQIAVLNQDNNTLEQQLDNMRIEIEVGKEDLVNFRSENVRLESELAQQATSLDAAKQKVLEKLQEAEQNVDALTNANNQLQKTCNTQSQDLEACHAQISAATTTMESLQSQLKILNTERQEMKIRVSQLTKSVEEVEVEKAVVKSTLETLQSEFATLKADLRMLSGENDNYKESMATYEEQIHVLEERNVQLESQAKQQALSAKSRLDEVEKENGKLKSRLEILEPQRQQLKQQLTTVTCNKEELQSTMEDLQVQLSKVTEEKQNLAKSVECLKAEKSTWQGTQSTTVQEHLQVIEKLQEQNEQMSRDCIKAKAEVVELLQFKKDAQFRLHRETEQTEEKKQMAELAQKVEKLTHQNAELFDKFQEAEKSASEAMDRAAKALEQHKKDWTAKRENMLENMIAKQDLQEQEREQLESDFQIISEKYQAAKEKLAQQENLQQEKEQLQERYRQAVATQARLEQENRTLKVSESHMLAKMSTEKGKLEARHQKQVQALHASATAIKQEAATEDLMERRRETMTVRSLRPSLSESSAGFMKDGFKIPAPAKSCTITSHAQEEHGVTNRRESFSSLGSVNRADSVKSSCEFSANLNQTFTAPQHEDTGVINRRQSSSSMCSATSTGSQRSVPQGAGKYFSCDDEAGEFFSSSYLSDVRSGKCVVEDPSKRMSELERRNTLCLPHLRSAYPTEFNDEKLRRLDAPAIPRLSMAHSEAESSHFDPVNTITEGTAMLSVITPPAFNTRGRKRRSFEIDETDEYLQSRESLGGSFAQSLSDSVSSQSSQGSVDRKRRKEVIMTSYHKPGPPTPAKNTSAVRERFTRAEITSPTDTPKAGGKGKGLKPKARTPLKSKNGGVAGPSSSKKTPSSLVKSVKDKLKQSKAANDENTPRTRSKLNIFRKPFGSRSYASDI